MPPSPCSGCEACGTTLEQHPDDHRKPSPHLYITKQVQTDEGTRPLTRCQWCMQLKVDIELQPPPSERKT